jgi:hypothetical protein
MLCGDLLVLYWYKSTRTDARDMRERAPEGRPRGGGSLLENRGDAGP